MPVRPAPRRCTTSCAGSATRGITVLLPEGVAGAKPMPKAGWTIATVDGVLKAPLMVHGVAVSSAVREVSWQGGPLADAQYDEFSLQIKVPDAAGKYYFKVSQVCEQGSVHWNEVPGAPGAVMKLKFPAPVLDVVPAAGQAHQH
ncbi:MAG: YcnI family protein [Massilia sp.]|nr:YcnI family protein [Massilia sp.]